MPKLQSSQYDLLHRITTRIRQSLQLQEILQATATEVRAFLRTDRVVVYRFYPDEHGEVIAEAVDSKCLPSLIGLHFPADDIPPHARQLFLQARQRSIVDLSAQQIGWSMPEASDRSEAIHYRPVDPCHIEYLKAMGVESSVVIPIVQEEQLWGLLVAHHSQPRTVSQAELHFLQLVVDQVAIAIAQSTLLSQVQALAHRERIANRIATLLHCGSTNPFQTALEATIESIEGSGGRLFLLPAHPSQSGELYTCGTQPSNLVGVDRQPLEQHPLWQAHTDSELLAITDLYQDERCLSLTDVFQNTPIRSLLILPLQQGQQTVGYLTLFRNEVETERLWAGKFDPDERQQMPRRSFERWLEHKTRQAQGWTETDLNLVQAVETHFAFAIRQYQLQTQVQALNTTLEQQVQHRTRDLTNIQFALNQSSIVSMTDCQGTICFVNDKFCEISKYSRDELIGQPHHLIKSAYQTTVFFDQMWQTITDGGVWRGEIKNLNKDGAEYWVDTTIVPLVNEQGKPYQYVAIQNDITERKQAEAALFQLAAIVESSEDAIISKTLDGVISSWNAGAERLFGYTAAEAIGQRISLLLPPDRLDEQSKILEKLKQGERIEHFETFRKRKDGTLVDISLTISPIKDPTGTIIGFSKIARDIRQQQIALRVRQQAEEALQNQTHLLNLILDGMSDGVVVANEQSHFLVFNPAAEQMFGSGATDTSEDEWSQKYGLFLPDQVTPFPTNEIPLARAIRGKETKDIEMFVRHAKAPDGCWVLINGRPLRDEAGQLRGGVVVCRDITDRKQAEAALAESEAKFRYLVENATDLIWSSTLEGKLNYLSPRFKEMTGFEPAEFLGQSLAPLVHPDDLSACLAFLRRVLETGEQQNGFEFQHKHKDGSWFWVSSNVSPVKNEAGDVIGFQGIIQDINDRRKGETALRQSEERLRSLMQASAQIIWSTNAEGQLVTTQPGWSTFTGQTFEEYQGWGWLNTIHPDDRDHVASMWSEAVASRSLHKVEFRMRRQDGEYRYMSCRAVPILQADGSIREWIGANTDITERKQAEDTLKQSEERFRSLIEATSQIVWNTDAEGNFVNDLPQWRAFTGQTIEEMLGWGWLNAIHPDDQSICTRRWTEALHTRTLYEAETRIRHHGGEYRYMNVRGIPVLNTDGSIREWIGTNTDIHDRKRAEVALQEREEQLRQFVEHAPISVIMLDQEMRYLIASQQWLQDYGLQAKDILGRSHYEIFPEITEEWRQIHQRCLSGVVERREEDPFLRADGSLDWVRWAIHPWYKAEGEVGGIIMFTETITERKQAEQKLRQTLDMLDLASDSIIIRDMNDRIVYWNQGAEKLYGWKREEVVGQYIHTFLQTVFPRPLETCLTEFLQQGQWEGELHHTTCEGRGIIVASRWTLQRDTSGQPFAQLEINSDITQRKAAEIALRQSEERLQAILDNSPAVIYMKDTQGQFITVNRQFESLFHVNKTEIIGKRNSDLFEQDLADIFDANDRAVLEAGTAMQWEEVAPHKDGLHTYLSLKFPLLAPEGNPYALCGISTDITERKQAEVALEQAKEAAETANRAKSEFLANMSHELRTPLNGVIGYAQILQRAKTLNEEDRARIEVIHQCGTHLLTLINDILDLSKIEARKTELMPTDFHLPAFLQGVAEMCRIRAELKGIQFRYESASELPMGVRADEKRLRQVLINLLSNAIKFTDAGSVTFTVSFAAAAKIRFVVRDTGIGIPQKNLQSIFQPFEQVSDAKRQAEGTGLGLAISQEIVELMDSTIQVQSEVGIGSIFWFDVELPQADEWMKTAQVDRYGQIIGIKDSQPRILVIDDKWENRSVISNLLSPIGFEVLEAMNGNDGWQKVLEFHPDLIITDLLMPDGDGFQLINQIRTSESFKDLIVIVSSASVFEADQYRSIEAGGNDFLPKPVLAAELLQKLQKHLYLQWIYEEEEPLIKPEIDPIEFPTPPATELKVIYELAMKGNFIGITKQAALLEQADAKYSPFAKKLQQLAKGFKDQEILALIQTCS